MTLRLRKDRIWPTLIVLALLGNVALGITLMRVAADDPHFAVEPDYYRKAVAWDSAQALAAATAALGWHAEPMVGAVAGGEPVPVAVTLTDRDGRPVAGAVVSLEARAVAHAAEPLATPLVPGAEPGRYEAALPVARTGLWELRVQAVRGRDLAAFHLRVEARADGPAVVVADRPGAPDPARVAAGTRTGE